MNEMLRFALLSWGISYLISQSDAGMPLRMLVAKLGVTATVGIYCAACVGFWVGLVLGFAGALPFEALYYGPLEGAVAAAGLNALIASVVTSNAFELEQLQLDARAGDEPTLDLDGNVENLEPAPVESDDEGWDVGGVVVDRGQYKQ